MRLRWSLLALGVLLAAQGVASTREFRGEAYQYVDQQWHHLVSGEPVKVGMLSFGVKFAPSIPQDTISTLIRAMDCEQRFVSVSGWRYVAATDPAAMVDKAVEFDTRPGVVDVVVDQGYDRLAYPNDPGFLPLDLQSGNPTPSQAQWENYLCLDENDVYGDERPPWADQVGSRVYHAWYAIDWMDDEPTHHPIIAIWDTGFWLDHPDLLPNFWQNEEEVNGIDGFDDDGNHYIDDYYGVNTSLYQDAPFVTNEDASVMKRLHGDYVFWHKDRSGHHGTITAGAALARSNNGLGVSSAASGWNGAGARLMVLTGEYHVSEELRAKGVAYAIGNGARIMSWSYSGLQQNIQDDIDAAFLNNQLVSFRSAGNEGDHVDETAEHVVVVGMTTLQLIPDTDSTNLWMPAGYGPNPSVLNSQLDEMGERYVETPVIYSQWSYHAAQDRYRWHSKSSGYGPRLTLMAPGGGPVLNIDPESLYDHQSTVATSWAAPHLASIAALVLAEHPSLTTSQLVAVLCQSATKLPGVGADYYHPLPIGYQDVGDPWYYYHPNGSPAFDHADLFIPSSFDYDDVNDFGNPHGIFDERMGYGRVDAARALEFASNLRWLGRPDPPLNVQYEELGPFFGGGVLLSWDPPEMNTDVVGYCIRRVRKNNEAPHPYYEMIEFGPIAGTQYADTNYTHDDYVLYQNEYSIRSVDISGFESNETRPLNVRVEDESYQDPGATNDVDDHGIPSAFALYDPKPNPFNSKTELRYDIPTECRVVIKVFNVAGRVTATVLDGTVQSGRHTQVLRADGWSSGVYFVQMQARGFTKTSKLVLLR